MHQNTRGVVRTTSLWISNWREGRAEGSANLRAGPQASKGNCDALHVDGLRNVALADVPQDVIVDGVVNVRIQRIEGALPGRLGL
jgi:hypothetical protein